MIEMNNDRAPALPVPEAGLAASGSGPEHSTASPDREPVCERASPDKGSVSTLAEEPRQRCGGRGYCARMPFCGCGGPDPLPERDATRTAEGQGLFRKFDVRRTDGSDRPGGKHEGCEYFVLDVAHDAHAKAALAAYASDVEATHPALARDMRDRYDLATPAAPAAAPAGWVNPRELATMRESSLYRIDLFRDNDINTLAPLYLAAPPAASRAAEGAEQSTLDVHPELPAVTLPDAASGGMEFITAPDSPAARHLHRLLGWVSCEIGQAPDEMVALVKELAPGIGHVDDAGKARLVEAHQKAAAVPQYVRAAVKALRKVLAAQPLPEAPKETQ